DLVRTLHPRKSTQQSEVFWTVEMGASLFLILDARLLAECRCQNERHIVAGEIEKRGQQLIHLLVAEQNGSPVLGLLLLSRFDHEMVGLHISPVGVLVVRGAVQEKCRKERTAFLE